MQSFNHPRWSTYVDGSVLIEKGSGTISKAIDESQIKKNLCNLVYYRLCLAIEFARVETASRVLFINKLIWITGDGNIWWNATKTSLFVALLEHLLYLLHSFC